MRKNKRYTKKEMFQSVEAWQERDQSLNDFCKEKNYSRTTFYYWIQKYRKLQAQSRNDSPLERQGFLPVQISKPTDQLMENPNSITIHYPNGILISFPSDIQINELRTLINL